MPDKESPLSGRLTPYLERVLDSYRALWQYGQPVDAKEFAVFHNACKSVLLHIALLKKITADDGADAAAPMLDWIERARQGASDGQTHDTFTDPDSILMDLEHDAEPDDAGAP